MGSTRTFHRRDRSRFSEPAHFNLQPPTAFGNRETAKRENAGSAYATTTWRIARPALYFREAVPREHLSGCNCGASLMMLLVRYLHFAPRVS
jgi:hypothetical protein